MTACSWGFHQWTKWQTYLWTGKTCYTIPSYTSTAIEVSETRQKRTCTRCGLEQDRLVK